jgi:acetolactate synthase-1/3 small subunit
MAYEIEDGAPPKIERHTMAVLVDNEPGVLARVVGLFSGRGYNIESLTVTTVSEDETVSRISIVTTGTPMIIEQIKAQLNRLVPVNSVHDLTEEGPHIERELALIKLVATGPNRREALRLGDIFRARVADTTTESFVFVLTGSKDKIDSFTELMRSLGEVEIARSGAVAIARGAKLL